MNLYPPDLPFGGCLPTWPRDTIEGNPMKRKEATWTMRKTIRLFLLLEGASFIVAGQVHYGVLVDGYEHPQAANAESLVGVVLLVGFVLTWVWPARTRSIGLAAQAFALLGTLV